MNLRPKISIIMPVYNAEHRLSISIESVLNQTYNNIELLLGSSLIFGIGVSNAGTAVRHRQKLIPVFLILLAIIMDCRKKLISKRNSKFRSEKSE